MTMTNRNFFHPKTFFLGGLAFISFLNVVAQTQPNGTVNDNSSGSTVSSDLNTNLRLWLDANDKTTMYTTTTVTVGQSIAELETANPVTDYTGTEIKLWLDKSNLNSHVSNTDPTKFPTYIADGGAVSNNLPTLEFSRNQQDHLRIALPETNGGNGERWEGEYTIFIVFEQLTDGGIDHSFFSNGDTFADDNHFQISVSAATGDDFVFKSNNGANVKFLDFEPEKQNELKLYSLRSDNNGTEALVDGTQSDFDAALTNNGNKFYAYNINRNRNNNSFNDSRISEVIIYDRILTDCELSEVNKYLGDKYGKDFSSSFAALYDDNLNSAYDNITAGIGLNEAICGGVTDKRNTDTSNGFILSVEDADNNINRNYIAFSDNGGTETRNDNVPTGISFQRLDKTWSLQEYGNNALGNQPLDFEFDIPTLWNGLQESSFVMLVDDDGDFSNAEFISGGALSSNKILFENVVLGTNTTLDLQTDTPIYIALAIHPSPGGIATSLEFWIKADAGTYEDANTSGDSNDATEDNDVVQAWHDNSSSGNHLDDVVVGTPTFRMNSVNYNPSVDFDGDDDRIDWDDGNVPWFEGDQQLTIYSVIKANAVGYRGWIDTETADDSSEQVFISQTTGNNGTFTLGANGDSSANYLVTSQDIRTTDPMIFGFDYDGNASTINTLYNAYIDGKEYEIAGGNSTNGPIPIGVDKFSLGDGDSGIGSDNEWDGQIAEVLTYERVLTLNEKQRVESYLALKYGIALDQSTPQNYIASDGTTTIWTATSNSGYITGIFGIGQDDGSGLNQKISRSVNSTSGPILATTQDFSTPNQDGGRTGLGDGNFMMMSHNNGTDNSFASSFDGGSNNRSDRVWKVEETGTVGNVWFAIPYSNATFPSGGQPALVISDDISFDDTDTSIALTYDRDAGLYVAEINPTDGQYIALAITDVAVANIAYFRTRSTGDSNTTTDGITSYPSYTDFIADTNGTLTVFGENQAFLNSFFADGIYFYRTNSVIDAIVRYPSLEDLAANTNGVTFNLSQTWSSNDEFFASGNEFFRTRSTTGTAGVTSYPSFMDMVNNTNGSLTNFATSFNFQDQFFHDGEFFLRTNTSVTEHFGVARYQSLNDLATDVIFDTQAFGPQSTDDDIFAVGITAGFETSETTLTINEDGGTDTFTVVLKARPSGNVVLDVVSNDTDEATVDEGQLIFTPSDWDTPQTVAVTGVNDDIDRDDTVSIIISVNDAASDDTFDTLENKTVDLTLTNDDTANFTVSETTLTIDENGGTGTFTVVLDTEPTSDVVLDITSNDTGEAIVDIAQLTFTVTDWDTPQTVTVTGVDDDVVRDDSATITIVINDASSDDAFDALTDKEVAITLTNEDVNLPVFTAPSGAYNVSAAEHAGSAEELTVSSHLPSPYGIAFSNDGTKLFASGIFSSEIVQYDLTAPFDVSPASYVTNLTGLSGRPLDIEFNGDGTKLFYTGSNSSTNIVEYTLSPAYDLSSATNKRTFSPTQGSNFDAMAFASAGNKMYLLINEEVLEYNLGTSYDPFSATYVQSYNITESNNTMDLVFNPDGTKMFVIAIGGDLLVYDLLTPFDISSADFAGTDSGFDTSGAEGNPYGLAFNDNGSKFFTIGATDRVIEFHIKASLSYDENETLTVTDVQANDGDGGVSDTGITYSLTSGGDNDLFSIDTDTGALTFLASPDFENPGDDGADNTYDIEVIATDVDGSTSLEISIVVNDVNEAPEITSTATVNFAENGSGTVLDVEASDEEGETEGSGLGYVFSTDSGGGIDNGSFDIDPDTGVITFAASPDFENPGDNDTNNAYELQITVSDSGGEEDIQDITIGVTDMDDTPPSGYSVAMDLNPINDTNRTATSFTFTAAEVGTTYNYTFSSSGGGTNVTGNGTIVTATDQITGIDLSGLGDGTISLSVTLTDTEGNEGIPATDTVNKDSIAPSGYTVEIDQNPINISSHDAASFTFSGAEVGTTYNYTFSSNGGGTNATGSGTIVTATDQITGIDLSGLGDGTTTLSVTLTDTAGNGGIAATDTATKDATAPSGYSVTIDQAFINNSNQNSISFTFSGAEVGTTYNYTFISSNGGTNKTGSGTIVTATDQIEFIDLSFLNDGNVALNVTLTDAAANEGTMAFDITTKDVVAPIGYTVSIDQDPINVSNHTAVSFTFARAELGTTYSYLIEDNGGSGNVSGSGTIVTATDQITDIDISGLADGTMNLSFSLMDASLNEGAWTGFSVSKETDVDNDGIKDDVDNCLTVANPDQTDTNNDNEGDACDDDDDGDGTLDTDDDFPLDGTEDTDTDGDGIGNNADTDDDNDGLVDAQDPNPLVDTQTNQPQLNEPIGNATSYDQLSVEYVLPEAPLPGSVTLTFTSNDNPNSPIVLQLDDTAIVPGLLNSFIWDPQVDVVSLSQVISATHPTLSDGTYDITLSYQDALGNPAATFTSANHTIITDLLVTSLSISSDNASPEWAKEGDRVIFDFSFNRPVDNAFLQYFGTALAFTGTPNNGSAYQGWIEVGPDTDEGTVNFTLTANGGSYNLEVTTTTDGSWVTVDITAPVPSLVIAESLYFGPFDVELQFSEAVENVAPAPIGVVPDNAQPTAELGSMEVITPGLVYRIPVTPLIPGELVFFNDLTDIARDQAGNPSVPLGFVDGTFYDLDSDGDGIGNTTDTDDDGDGTPDTDDDFPLDANEDTDTDDDGTGDNADTDDDGDGTPDTDDDFPLNANEDMDTDGDGTGDNADTDDDGDGAPDTEDDFPLDASEDTDTDGDGIGDNTDTDDDNDGIPDTQDENPNEPLDSDGDGIPNSEDSDDDNDGVPDTEDDFPTDPNEDTDTDGDGDGDNSDTDDDNDDIPDSEDADVDGDGTIDNGTDSDGDGINDENDDVDDSIDTDGDGVPDVSDDFPNDPNESVDEDGDGIGANTDIDDNDAGVGQEQPITSAQAFTPNGDNINDTWIVRGIENYPNAMVTVYNRYGHEVFKAIGYKNDWNGRYGSKSENLPAGSYYYVIDLRNGSAPLDGWIFINY